MVKISSKDPKTDTLKIIDSKSNRHIHHLGACGDIPAFTRLKKK